MDEIKFIQYLDEKTALEEVSNTINTLSTEDLPTVFVSAKSGANISSLIETIDSILTSTP